MKNVKHCNSLQLNDKLYVLPDIMLRNYKCLRKSVFVFCINLAIIPIISRNIIDGCDGQYFPLSALLTDGDYGGQCFPLSVPLADGDCGVQCFPLSVPLADGDCGGQYFPLSFLLTDGDYGGRCFPLSAPLTDRDCGGQYFP
jgi:hypothetical protein